MHCSEDADTSTIMASPDSSQSLSMFVNSKNDACSSKRSCEAKGSFSEKAKVVSNSGSGV